ncbi:VOC family protein [Actinosynnema sp. NPDC059797]
MTEITPLLMFQGRAEEAMTFYTSLFPGSEVLTLTRYGPEGPGAVGSVVHATFTLAGQRYACIDSSQPHDFTFTPSVSLYVNCEDEEDLDRLYAALSEGGEALMPLGDYGFSRKFGWVNDRFGVSWQLNLPS